jgi:Flp pilus assembly protein TadD
MDPRPLSPGKSPFQEAFDKARVAFNAGQVGAAARLYHAALRAKPGHARSIKELGRCYVRLGQPCRALRYYKRYARLRPGDFFVKHHIQTLSPKCGGK